MEGEVSVDMGDIVVERRARFGQAYVQLRQAHPLLPEQLRLFQVSQYTCVLKKPLYLFSDRRCCRCHYGTDGHILSCVPTGYGKTMPMLITSLLLPPGDSINIIWKPSEGLKLQILFWSPWKLSWRGAHLGL